LLALHLFQQLGPALLDDVAVFRREHVRLWERIAPMKWLAGVNQYSACGVSTGFFLCRREPWIEVLGPNRFQYLYGHAGIGSRANRPQDIAKIRRIYIVVHRYKERRHAAAAFQSVRRIESLHRVAGIPGLERNNHHQSTTVSPNSDDV